METKIFNGAGRSIKVYKEVFITSVACYHDIGYPEDPTQEDPLAEFGAVNRELPDRDPACRAGVNVQNKRGSEEVVGRVQVQAR
jgi:hypothetical protein